MNSKAKVLYQEKQRFTKWWMWLVILLPLEIALNAFYFQYSLDIPLGNKPLTDEALIAFFLFGIAFAYFFRINELRTELTEDGIHVHFYPYTSGTVAWGGKLSTVRLSLTILWVGGAFAFGPSTELFTMYREERAYLCS